MELKRKRLMKDFLKSAFYQIGRLWEASAYEEQNWAKWGGKIPKGILRDIDDNVFWVLGDAVNDLDSELTRIAKYLSFSDEEIEEMRSGKE